jgi:hypothetical protein
MDNNALEIIFYTILVIGVIVVLFLLLREVICWYYKINERISLQIKTNELLEKLVNRSNSSFDNFSSSNNKTSIYNNSTTDSNFQKTDSLQSITKSEVSKDYDYRKGIIGVPIELEGFEVAQFDFKIKLNWVDARNACNRLGDGWNLPSKEQLKIIYDNRLKLTNFSLGCYFSATKNEDNMPWTHDFLWGSQIPKDQKNKFYIRAIRITK